MTVANPPRTVEGDDDRIRGPSTATTRALPSSDVRALPSLDVGAARDAALADRIRSGDRMALGELYDRYAPLALAAALRSSPDRTRAEAAVHDAFVAVWKGIDRFDHVTDDLSTWVMGLVRRHRAQ